MGISELNITSFQKHLVMGQSKCLITKKRKKIELWDAPQLIKLFIMNHNNTQALVKAKAKNGD
jgi:hypothetical protein